MKYLEYLVVCVILILDRIVSISLDIRLSLVCFLDTVISTRDINVSILMKESYIYQGMLILMKNLIISVDLLLQLRV